MGKKREGRKIKTTTEEKRDISGDEGYYQSGETSAGCGDEACGSREAHGRGKRGEAAPSHAEDRHVNGTGLLARRRGVGIPRAAESSGRTLPDRLPLWKQKRERKGRSRQSKPRQTHVGRDNPLEECIQEGLFPRGRKERGKRLNRPGKKSGGKRERPFSLTVVMQAGQGKEKACR